MEYYSHKKWEEDITVISGISGENMFLIEGKDKAVLIDSGVGLGDLRSYVEGLSHKDLTVLLTHGHLDHAMGAAQFDAVYMNEADEAVYQKGIEPRERLEYIRMGIPDKTAALTEDILNTKTELHYTHLTDGASFDLGGLHVDAYSLPGHTQGSMVILIREKGILILGDACTDGTFLFSEEASSVEEYYETLLEVSEKLEGTYHTVFRSHGEPETDRDMMKHVLEVCEDIFSGNVDAVPMDFRGQACLQAKRTGEGYRRLDGKVGNIIYRRIYKEEPL
ncbi:MAG: MBL fold metallo-hydrolase [Lachnospiraceae bacterium]|nr:MBL fold metallo-hydrolase [Lachnospiraceae bacterium]